MSRAINSFQSIAAFLYALLFLIPASAGVKVLLLSSESEKSWASLIFIVMTLTILPALVICGVLLIFALTRKTNSSIRTFSILSSSLTACAVIVYGAWVLFNYNPLGLTILFFGDTK